MFPSSSSLMDAQFASAFVASHVCVIWSLLDIAFNCMVDDAAPNPKPFLYGWMIGCSYYFSAVEIYEVNSLCSGCVSE